MSTAGPNAPGTMADDSSYGGVAWGNVNNAKVSDNAYANLSSAYSLDTHYLKATNFGFAIPSGATINGVSVSIERKKVVGNPNSVEDSVIKLVKGGTVSGTNKSATATWNNTEGVVTFGGASDLWGLSLTDSDVNASNFGVVISASMVVIIGKAACVAYVDFISITIDYTTGGGGLSRAVASQSYRQRRV